MDIELRQDTAEGFAKTNPILEDWEIGKESDTNKAKFGDGITPWNDLGYMGVAMGGGVAVASSLEEAEKMDIKDGEYVNIYKQDTRFAAKSLVDVGMVSYDEMNCQITSLNGAKIIESPPDLWSVLTYPGSGYVKLVSAKDPTCRYEVHYNDKEGVVMGDYYYYNDLMESIWDAEYYYHGELYIYEAWVTEGQTGSGSKKVTAENFAESEEELRWWDNKITLNGGEKGEFERCIKRDGGIYPLVVNAVLNFEIPRRSMLGYFEIGEGSILVSNSTRLFPGQYLKVAEAPHLAKIGDDMSVSFIHFEEDAANSLMRMFKTTLSLSSDKPVGDEVSVDWNSYAQSLDPNLYSTPTSWQHVQTVSTSSDHINQITVPDIRYNSRIVGASVLNSYEFIEFSDSAGVAFFGIESSLDPTSTRTYWIDATCERNETNGKYNILIKYKYAYDDDPEPDTWHSEQITHDYPLASISVPKATKTSAFKIYQELPNI